MSIDWHAVEDYLYGNRVAIGSAVMLITTAAIKTAPIPESRAGKWAYDFGHQVFNLNNTRLSTASIITPPSPKEESVQNPK